MGVPKLAKAAVGMEVNQSEVIVVSLQQGRKGPAVAGYARVPLAAGVVTTSRVAHPHELRTAAVAALQNARAGHVNICLSVFSETMDARIVRYPAMPKRELLSNIQWDLQQLFGTGDDGSIERLVDVEVLPPRAKAGSGAAETDNKQTFVAVSAPRRTVYEYIDPLHQGRVYPEIVDIGAFSLPWAVPRGGGVAYLHLGPELTHFVVSDNGAFAMQRQSGLALGRASRDRMLDWLDETLEFVRVQHGSFTVDEHLQTLIVSGVGATAPGILPLIGDRTGLHVVAAVPTVLSEGRETIPTEEAPVYALAVGLAQRGLSEL